MKKLLLAGILGLFMAPSAEAQYNTYVESYEAGVSSYTVYAAMCSSGTPTQWNSGKPLPGFNIQGYRLQNQSTSGVWIGSVNMSTAALGAQFGTYGALLVKDAMVPLPVGKKDRTYIPLYCMSEDAATDGTFIAVEVFGYR